MSEAVKKLEESRSEALGRVALLADIATDDISLADAETQLRQIKDLTVELTGKKSRVAEFKKEIGKVDQDERA
ncbi:MAG TPA: hypothetical protein VEV84_04600, partial [Pyrinomonadaceae bacterium]|nr:hypothetical protein [Pyrinomonadaceae bacterium]